jgi:hypothetical protein
MEQVVFVISDMSAKLDPVNVEKINALTELFYSDVINVTYNMLYEDRKNARGMGHGQKRNKDGSEFWVLPYLNIGMVINPNSNVIKEYEVQEYLIDIEPSFDPLPDLEE